MKNTIMYMLLLTLPFYLGCSTLFNSFGGVDFPAFPVKGKEFDYLVGKRYEVIRPLIVGKFEQTWGGYVLVAPDFSIRKIVEVPVGSIIVMDHVSMSYNIVLGKFHHYIALFEDKNIFRDRFDISYFAIGPDNNTSLDPEYFKEWSY